MDVARAFFEAPVHRGVCIEIPEEDLESHEVIQDLVGRCTAHAGQAALDDWCVLAHLEMDAGSCPQGFSR